MWRVLSEWLCFKFRTAGLPIVMFPIWKPLISHPCPTGLYAYFDTLLLHYKPKRIGSANYESWYFGRLEMTLRVVMVCGVYLFVHKPAVGGIVFLIELVLIWETFSFRTRKPMISQSFKNSLGSHMDFSFLHYNKKAIDTANRCDGGIFEQS